MSTLWTVLGGKFMKYFSVIAVLYFQMTSQYKCRYFGHFRYEMCDIFLQNDS